MALARTLVGSSVAISDLVEASTHDGTFDVSTPLGGSVTAGDLIIVACGGTSGTNTTDPVWTTPAYSSGTATIGTVSQVGNARVAANNSASIRVWQFQVTGSGTLTISYGDTPTSFGPGIIVTRYTGHDTTTPTAGVIVDAEVATTLTPATATLSATPTADDEVHAYIDWDANAAAGKGVTAGSGFTERASIGGTGDFVEMQLATRTGSTSTSVPWGTEDGTPATFSTAGVAFIVKAAAQDASIIYQHPPGRRSPSSFPKNLFVGSSELPATGATGQADAAFGFWAYVAAIKGALGQADAPMVSQGPNSATTGRTGVAAGAVTINAKNLASTQRTGAAVGGITVNTKNTGVHGAIGTAKAGVTVNTKDAGIKGGVSVSKAALTVASAAAATKQGLATVKGALTFWSRTSSSTARTGTGAAGVTITTAAAGTKGATTDIAGAAIGAVTINAKAAGVHGGVGVTKAGVTISAKAAGVHGGIGTAKAGLTIAGKDAAVKGALGQAKADPTFWARSAIVKGAKGALKAVLAWWARATGAQPETGPYADVPEQADARTIGRASARTPADADTATIAQANARRISEADAQTIDTSTIGGP